MSTPSPPSLPPFLPTSHLLLLHLLLDHPHNGNDSRRALDQGIASRVGGREGGRGGVSMVSGR